MQENDTPGGVHDASGPQPAAVKQSILLDFNCIVPLMYALDCTQLQSWGVNSCVFISNLMGKVFKCQTIEIILNVNLDICGLILVI